MRSHSLPIIKYYNIFSFQLFRDTFGVRFQCTPNCYRNEYVTTLRSIVDKDENFENLLL